MNKSISNNCNMASDEDEPDVLGDEDKRLKRKQSLEASVHLGLGYGKKKKQHLEAFYSAVWPVLQGAGWTLEKGVGEDEGATYFLPPGVTIVNKGDDGSNNNEEQPPSTPKKESTQDQVKEDDDEEVGPWDCKSCGHTNPSTKSRCTGLIASEGEDGSKKCFAWRGGKKLKKSYYTKVRDVIERILEKQNEAETMAADSYLELIPNGADMFLTDQKDKSGVSESPSSPSRGTPRQVHINHFAWKDERTHYEKASSRVGPEYQVDTLPVAGSYTFNSSAKNTTEVNDGGALYNRVWDPEAAEKSGKADFVDTRIKFNKKDAAYDIFYNRGFRLPGFYHEVSKLGSTDASEWTKNDKERFRAAVFEHHEDMKSVSKAIGKPINECITHYLVRFKKTKSYKSLKRSMNRKANVSEGNAGTLVCNECGKGGMLIACDTCEAHYHLDCATPPLQSIPDGTWVCGNCRRDTRSMLSSQDETSLTDQQQPMDTSVEGAASIEDKDAASSNEPGDDADADNNNGKLTSASSEHDTILKEGEESDPERKHESDDTDAAEKRKFGPDFESMQGEIDTNLEPTNGYGPSHKRIRMEESNGETTNSSSLN